MSINRWFSVFFALLTTLPVMAQVDHSSLSGVVTDFSGAVVQGAKVEAIWDAEDEELVTAAQRLLDHYRQRDSSVA